MIKVKILFCIVLFTITGKLPAQLENVHPQSADYEYPDDPLVAKKLETWRDLKFGVIIHWGLYAVPGIIESWALCSEDWITRPDSMTYCEFKEWYWGLKKAFNPTNFDPAAWASAAKDAGMRYVVFTTKHHDGFCMFDTKETDFKITAGPFAGHSKANIVKHVFEAFRKEGFMIGAYFSKPDWHSRHYWRPQYATPDRNNNYDIRKYPDVWDNFKRFTHNQIIELMMDYGRVDILWLDGGWVRPLETVNDEVISWGARIPEWSQDIDMPKVADMSRNKQPGLLIVDRTVHGPFENYQTPERRIPEHKLEYPWESCIPLGDNWGYVPGDKFKSATEIIHLLIETTAKGGSMLLGIGPKPDGTLGEPELQRLRDIGDWMKINGAAIYETRSAQYYHDGETFFTCNKDGSFNALVRITEGVATPEVVEWKGCLPRKGSQVRLLQTNKKIKWETDGETARIYLPSDVHSKIYPALVFSFQAR